MNIFTKKTVALIVVLVALAAAAWYMFGSAAGGLDYPNADKYTGGDAEITGAVNSLFVDWTSGKVTVEYWDSAAVSVSETASRTLSADEKLRWWLDGDMLRIRFMKPGLRLSFNLDKQLTVRLPRGLILKSADISATSGDLRIPILNADEIRLDTTSGNIEAATNTKVLSARSTSGGVSLAQEGDLDSAVLSSTSGGLALSLKGSVKTVSLDSTSGGAALSVSGRAEDVKMRSTSGGLAAVLESADRAEISSTSGGAAVSAVAFGDLKVNTTSGGVGLDLGTEPGFTCKVSTASGDFTTDLAMTKNGDTWTCGDGSAKCTVSTTSGDIRLGKAE